MPLDAWRVGGDLTDPEGSFPERFGISPSGALLVRPDGFVCWRAASLTTDPAAALREALGRGLAALD